MSMLILCAWCGAHLGEKDGEGVSHGICDLCLWREYPDFAARIIEAKEGNMTRKEREELDIEKADDVLDEKRFQAFMEDKGAKKIGVALYEEQ